MKFRKSIIAMFLTIAGSFGIANAQTPSVVLSDAAGWHKIGERTVEFKTERDEIAVLGADRFSRLKFKVTDAPIDLLKAEVIYESGDHQNISINQSLKSSGESKAIDLKNGSERSIKKIIFDYKTLPNSKDDKAHIEIWGLKTNAVK